ncbi:MAG: type II toxin-antitoxin system prevent-host-death family antitoxin [Planctomycetaceae bacterium]
MKVVDVRNNLADALNRVAYAGERIVLERRGKGVAVLVSMADLELLQKIEDEADIKAARTALKEKGEVSLEEIKKRLGMK